MFFDRRVFAFAFALVLGFLAGTPYFLTEYPEYASRIFTRFDLMDTQTQSPSLGIGWWYHLKFSLWHGLGWGLYLAAFAGMVLYFMRDWRRALILISFPLVYYWVAGKGHTVFLRYMIPVLPFMCMTAAYFVFEVYHFLKKRFSYRATVVGTGLLMTIILFQGSYNLWHFSRLIAKTDSRLLGKEWVMENIPQGSAIYQHGGGSEYAQLQLPHTLQMIEKKLAKAKARGESGRVELARIQHLKGAGLSGYSLFSFKDSLVVAADSLPDYMIIHEYPLLEFLSPPDSIQKLLNTQYKPIHHIQAVNSEYIGNQYDQHDAFFLPFSGFYEVERLGNNMTIYTKK